MNNSKTQYLVLSHHPSEPIFKNVRVLHKASTTFMGGYCTKCFLLQEYTNALLKDETSNAKLASTIKDAGKFDRVCPYCFPNGLEQ